MGVAEIKEGLALESREPLGIHPCRLVEVDVPRRLHCLCSVGVLATLDSIVEAVSLNLDVSQRLREQVYSVSFPSQHQPKVDESCS
jgi:small basic protein